MNLEKTGEIIKTINQLDSKIRKAKIKYNDARINSENSAYINTLRREMDKLIEYRAGFYDCYCKLKG